MKLYFLLLLSFNLFTGFSVAQESLNLSPSDSNRQTECEVRISDIELELSHLERKLQIIDKTQLNYEIEKDLIKETYSHGIFIYRA